MLLKQVEVADKERELIEGNIMGYIQNKKNKLDVYAEKKDEEGNELTTKTFTIKPPS